MDPLTEVNFKRPFSFYTRKFRQITSFYTIKFFKEGPVKIIKPRGHCKNTENTYQKHVLSMAENQNPPYPLWCAVIAEPILANIGQYLPLRRAQNPPCISSILPPWRISLSETWYYITLQPKIAIHLNSKVVLEEKPFKYASRPLLTTSF